MTGLTVGDWYYIVIDRQGGQFTVSVNGGSETILLGTPLIGDRANFSIGTRLRTTSYYDINEIYRFQEIRPSPAELDGLFHTFSTWKSASGANSAVENFHSEVIRIGPTAFDKLADGTLVGADSAVGAADAAVLPGEIGFYSPLLDNLDSISPGKVLGEPFWKEIVADDSPLFSSVSQEFEGESFTVEVTISPAAAVDAVEKRVTPRLGIFNYGDGDTISFKAPEFVYVDRQGRALPLPPDSDLPSAENIQNHAVERWRTLGYTVVGTSLSGTDRAVDIRISENVTFEWQFQRELAVIVDSALPDELDSLGSGNPRPAVQKHWVQEGSSQIARIDGAVFAPDSANDVRYRIRGYELQNSPSGGTGKFLRQAKRSTIGAGKMNVDTTGGASISFWLRGNRSQQTYKNLMRFGNVYVRSGGANNTLVRVVKSGVNHNLRPVETYNETDRWNHFCLTYDPSKGNLVSLYRNGRLVDQKDGVRFDNSLTHFQPETNQARCDVDNIRIWERPLQVPEIRDAMHVPVLADDPNLSPVVELTFDDGLDPFPTLPDLDWRMVGSGVTAQWDSISRPELPDSDLAFVPVSFNDPQQVPEFFANEFAVIRWHWQKEYRIDNLTVNGLFDTALSQVAGSGDTLDSAGSLWVRHGDSLQVRADKVVGGDSVNGFVGQPTGLFENLGFAGSNLVVTTTTSNLTDATDSAEYGVDADFVDKPGRLIWNYGETIHVVEVPLGTAVDPAGGTILSPSGDLSSLGLSDTSVAPYTISMLVGDNPNDATVGNVARWDSVARKLYPVRPGQFLMSWPKEDGTGDKSIRVIAGFPNDSYRWDDGSDRTIAGTGGEFPATPNAHYRALYNPAVDAIADGENPPLDLDADPLDRWFFDPTSGLAYSERITRDGGVVTERSLARTSINTQGGLEIVEDSRSVLVFSARPIAEEVATGDLLREELLIRVVESKPVSAATYLQSDLSTGDGYVGNFDDDDTMVAVSGGPDPNGSWTVDFWAKREEDSHPNFEDTVIGMGSVRTLEQHLSIGFRQDIDGNDFKSNQFTVNLVGRPAILVDPELTDSKWHHWAVTYNDTDGNKNVSIYRDGVLVVSSNGGLSTNLTNDWGIGKAIYTNNSGQPFAGKIDNVRVWTAVAMGAAEIAELPFTATPTREPDLNFTFDTQASGSDLPQVGSFAGSGVVSGSAAADPNSLLLVSDVDAAPEVATKLFSRFDRAGFGTGFFVPTVANYNTNLYNRGAAVGEWGPIYPVNSSDAAGADAAGAGSDSPTTVWYDNLSMPDSLRHPNVDWPNVALEYSEVRFPETGPHKDKRIHIASR
ncbi:MAG: LamG-like jellyroll fold domain-containing protein, partial [Verrucomicrobiales bacterium]